MSRTCCEKHIPASGSFCALNAVFYAKAMRFFAYCFFYYFCGVMCHPKKKQAAA